MDWIENIIWTDEQIQGAKDKLKIINEKLGTNFTLKTPFSDILEAISIEWNKSLKEEYESREEDI